MKIGSAPPSGMHVISQSGTNIEQMLVLQEKQKILSKIYNILLEKAMVVDRAQQKWQIDLGKEISEGEWRYLYISMQKSACNVSLREHYYKLHHQWYLIPSRLSKMYAELLLRCWRCNVRLHSCICGGLALR